jgi:FMN reductase
VTEQRLIVVSGGLRVPSSTRLLGDRLAAAVTGSLRDGGHDPGTTVVELREEAHAVTDALLTGFPTGSLRAAVEAVQGADGLIVVSPTFSASFSGLFKSFFDLFEGGSLPATPTLLAATGGTERHSLVLEHALRPLFVYLGASPVRTAVYAATSDFGGEGAARLQSRIGRAAAELAEAMATRSSGAPRPRPARSPEEEVVPFEELLARGRLPS